jgi:dCTP deaminase
MILTRHSIQDLIDKKLLNFSPNLDKYQNQPHAVDLRLGTVFYISKTWKLTPNGREIITVDMTKKDENNYEKVELKPGQYFDLAPGESIIASTLEKIEIKAPNLMGVLYPRSSINRRGLSVDLTGIIDAFYAGSLMIPILNKTNSQIIRIYPGERICQVLFHRLEDDLTQEEAMLHGKISAKYQNTSSYELDSKKDEEDELKYIKSGDLTGLKKYKF